MTRQIVVAVAVQADGRTVVSIDFVEGIDAGTESDGRVLQEDLAGNAAEHTHALVILTLRSEYFPQGAKLRMAAVAVSLSFLRRTQRA